MYKVFILWFLLNNSVLAEIFRCEKLDGSIYYQEKFCSVQTDLQHELHCQEKLLTKQEITAIEKDLKRQRRELLKRKKEQDKLKAKAAKRHAQEKKKRLRLQVKCANVRQQIALLNQEYRNGYTTKRGLFLNRKLAEYKLKQREYCTHE